MSKARKVLLGATVLAVLSAAPSVTSIAMAGAENLICNAGFRKIQTHTSSIKCFKERRGYATASLARKASNPIIYGPKSHGGSNKGGRLCNSTHGRVKTRVLRKNGRWAYQQWFTCVIIY